MLLTAIDIAASDLARELWIQHSNLAAGGFGRVMREDQFLDVLKAIAAPSAGACDCTVYNGGPCYNCINGVHHICDDGNRVCPAARSTASQINAEARARLDGVGQNPSGQSNLPSDMPVASAPSSIAASAHPDDANFTAPDMKRWADALVSLGQTPTLAGLILSYAEAWLRERAAYEEPAQRRARLESIVAFLFPKYDARRAERPAVIHPERRWWWNGASIDENDVDIGSAGYGAVCTITSYIGSNDYDNFKLEIPAAWMDAEDFKSLITAWVSAGAERCASNERAEAEVKAKADLADAQRRLSEIRRSGETEDK